MSSGLCRSLFSCPTQVEDFCLEVRNLLMSLGLSAETFPVELLLRESLNNAMIHGNGGSKEKMIRVQVRIMDKWLLLRVKDEGSGFDWKKAARDAPDPGCTCGRGLPIYALYAERISFNAKGNEVYLWRAVKGD